MVSVGVCLPDELSCEPEEGLLEVVLYGVSDKAQTDGSLRTLDLAEISKYWRFSETDQRLRCTHLPSNSLFRWKVTFPVLTFRSYNR
jgi:hypothetical protein